MPISIRAAGRFHGIGIVFIASEVRWYRTEELIDGRHPRQNQRWAEDLGSFARQIHATQRSAAIKRKTQITIHLGNHLTSAWLLAICHQGSDFCS